MKKTLSFSLIVLILAGLTFLLEACEEKAKQEPLQKEVSFLYKNHADTAKYIGAQECKKCHQSIYNQYMLSLIHI